ncbi:MAG TPA: DUF1127 domain-containing protein [Stellaceae bacterium]|nr:DUF1127 domain-containing protein [Stellaceae bacterium]
MCRTLGELLRAGFSMLALWSRRVRQRRELATYDRSMLRDIGVTPSEVASEVRKPFWRA